MESLKLTSSTNNTKNSSNQGISANSFSKLLLQFEDFVASTDNPVMTLSSTCPAAKQKLNGARQQFNQQSQTNYKVTKSCINKIRDYLIHSNGFHMEPTPSSVAKRNGYTCRSKSSLSLSTLTSLCSSSTHSSPVPYTSSSSSSTHSSPILSPSPRTPSPVLGGSPPSLFQHTSNLIAPPRHNGADLSKLSSQRDPVTNKIFIKTMINNLKDKDSPGPSLSKSVIAEAATSSSLLRTTVVESAKSQPGSKGSTIVSSSSSSSVPFSLPPLSVRSTENHNQENLPDLLKPKNLAKYVHASAPKKKPTERNKQSNSVLLDHDYSLAVREENTSERKYKRTFIIPKKRSCTKSSNEGWTECKLQDNLEVVDMECSDTEVDSPVIVDEKDFDKFNWEKTKNEMVETPSNVALMLYGHDEYRSQCTLIEEEAEIRYAKGHFVHTDRDESNYYNNQYKMIDPFNSQEGEPRGNYCLLNPMPQSGANPDTWWQEIEDVVKSVHPNCENSVFSHLTEVGDEDKLLKISNDDAAAGNTKTFTEEEAKIREANLQESEFYSILNFVKNSDSFMEPENVPVDQFDMKEEIVEESSFLSEEPTITLNEIFFSPPPEETAVAGQYVSLLSPGQSQPTPDTSDPRFSFLDESKENMVDKVPAYLSTARLGIKKNVLQRINLKSDELSMTREQEKNRCSPLYENRSPSPHENRSPSPDYSSGSSRNPHRDVRHRKYDYHRHRHQRLSRSRSRSPAYSHRQTSKTCQQRTDNDEDEQRRVVYVGKLPNNFTNGQLKDLFKKYGEIEKVSLYFRSGKDNYGFVAFKDKGDATSCLEDTHQIPDFPYEVCYGGRREFCKEEYADLDGITEQQEEFGLVSLREDTSFEQLLKQYSRDRRR